MTGFTDFWLVEFAHTTTAMFLKTIRWNEWHLMEQERS